MLLWVATDSHDPKAKVVIKISDFEKYYSVTHSLWSICRGFNICFSRFLFFVIFLFNLLNVIKTWYIFYSVYQTFIYLISFIVCVLPKHVFKLWTFDEVAKFKKHYRRIFSLSPAGTWETLSFQYVTVLKIWWQKR